MTDRFVRRAGLLNVGFLLTVMFVLLVGGTAGKPFNLPTAILSIVLLIFASALDIIVLWILRRGQQGIRQGAIDTDVVFTECFLIQFIGLALRIAARDVDNTPMHQILGIIGTTLAVIGSILLLVQFSRK